MKRTYPIYREASRSVHPLVVVALFGLLIVCLLGNFIVRHGANRNALGLAEDLADHGVAALEAFEKVEARLMALENARREHEREHCQPTTGTLAIYVTEPHTLPTEWLHIVKGE
jgi:hypothetical protein